METSTVVPVPLDYPPEIIGYADPWIVSPGESVDIKVSSTAPLYSSRLVRLIQGLDVPNAPPVESETVSEIGQRTHQGRFQLARPGSYGVVNYVGLRPQDRGIAISLLVQPTHLDAAHDQTIMSLLDSDASNIRGMSVVIGSANHLKLVVGTGETGSPEVLLFDYHFIKDQWVSLSIQVVGSKAQVTIVPVAHLSQRRGEVFNCECQLERGRIAIPDAASLIIAASRLGADTVATDFFNGRIEAVQLSAKREDAAPSASCGFSTLVKLDMFLKLSTDALVDVSGHGRHGRLVNAPTRAVRGHDWDGSETDWSKASYGYGAIHFHEDDLDDARWETDFSLCIPQDCRSGAYSVKIWHTGDDFVNDDVVFFVRPAPRPVHQKPKIALVLSTFTYMAYANERMYDKTRSSRLALIGQEDEECPSDDHFSRMRRRTDLGLSLYDVHLDGSGSVFSTTKRPILNVRPGFQHWAFGRPREFSADLLMIGYLERLGLGYDVVTDDCLHALGADGLAGYSTLISGSHPEYPSLASLDAHSGFSARGGNICYLGGNGYYWLSVLDPANPHRLEVRRGDQGVRTFSLPGGERHHSLNGAQGGLWRSRGRAANQLFGVGCCGEGLGPGVPYSRAAAEATQPSSGQTPDGVELAAARKEYAAWVFKGLSPGELIGTHGFGGGASGDEIDRWDPDNGSPKDAVVLASSVGHPDDFGLFPEDATFQDTRTLGTQTSRIRSDMVMWSTPSGGLTFSVGSMNWYCSLAWRRYENNVAVITENVIRRMEESPRT